jgi:hypothetical protein
MGHVTWVPCHHGMKTPQDADGEDVLQIRRVAANNLRKPSRVPWGFGAGPKPPHREKLACYEMLHGASKLSALVNRVMNLRVP